MDNINVEETNIDVVITTFKQKPVVCRSWWVVGRVTPYTVNKPESLNLSYYSVLQIGLNLKLYVG